MDFYSRPSCFFRTGRYVAISQKLTSVDGRLPMAGTFGDTMPAAEVRRSRWDLRWVIPWVTLGQHLHVGGHTDLVVSPWGHIVFVGKNWQNPRFEHRGKIEVMISKACADDSGLNRTWHFSSKAKHIFLATLMLVLLPPEEVQRRSISTMKRE